MKLIKALLLCLFISVPALAFDLVDDTAKRSNDEVSMDNPTRTMASADEVVLDNSFSSTRDWNEPVFTSRGYLRDVARANPEADPADVDWFGELTVQREIPFTYPVVTRLTLQLRTLNELEALEAKNQ